MDQAKALIAFNKKLKAFGGQYITVLYISFLDDDSNETGNPRRFWDCSLVPIRELSVLLWDAELGLFRRHHNNSNCPVVFPEIEPKVYRRLLKQIKVGQVKERLGV